MRGLGRAFDIIPAVLPLDLQTARVGDVVSLKNAAGVAVVIFKAAGTDGDDQTFTFLQGTDVAFGTNKALNFTEYFEKEGTLTSVGAWTKVTQASGNTLAPGDPSAQSQAVYVVEFDAADFDVNGGYDCLRVESDGAGSNAQLGAILYLLHGLAYPSAPDSLPSAIVD